MERDFTLHNGYTMVVFLLEPSQLVLEGIQAYGNSIILRMAIEGQGWN